MITSFEHAKYIVTRNVFIFTCSSMALLACINLFTNGSNFLTATFAFMTSGFVLVYLIKSKTYLIPAILAIVLAFGLNMFNLTRASNFENYIDLFWLINLSLFAYFTLGKIIGHVYLGFNIIGIFLISVLEKLNLITLIPASNIYTVGSYIDLGVNLSICTLFFGYLVSQFLKQTFKAKNEAIVYNIELQKQYDEKSIMLKEIHHRVKNNLQVITSLLRLQLYKLDDNQDTQPFQESINRVSSMALIHEQMYQGDKVKDIDIETYIKDLTKNLRDNYSNAEFVELRIDSEIKSIKLNSIVPISLILNELISNSLKHAFNLKNDGIIIIEFIELDMHSLKMIYCDNGEWKKPIKKDSFGLELIETFTQQLDGTFELNTEKGTKFTFEFKDIDIKH